MKEYSIYRDYDLAKPPIGTVIINDDVPEDEIKDGAIIPYLVKQEVKYETKAFGLVPRTSVDTRPRRL